MFITVLKAVAYAVVSWIVIRNVVVMIHNDNELQKKYAKEGIRY